jgi:hypothetical protein
VRGSWKRPLLEEPRRDGEVDPVRQELGEFVEDQGRLVGGDREVWSMRAA